MRFMRERGCQPLHRTQARTVVIRCDPSGGVRCPIPDTPARTWPVHGITRDDATHLREPANTAREAPEYSRTRRPGRVHGACACTCKEMKPDERHPMPTQRGEGAARSSVFAIPSPWLGAGMANTDNSRIRVRGCCECC